MARPLAAGTALLLVVLLAGCNGFTGDAGTLTPANASAGQGATGVSADGVDPVVLADTHDAVLAETNYTVVVRERIVGDNRTLRTTTFRRYVAPGADRYLINRSYEFDGLRSTSLAPRVDIWYDGEVALLRLGDAGSQRYQRTPTAPPGPLPDPSSHRRTARVLGAFDLRVTPAQNGSTYRVTSTAVRDAASIPTPIFVGQATNASVEATVTERGVVRDRRLTYTATLADRPGRARVVRTVRVHDVGSTTVRPPLWTADVPEADVDG